MNSLVNLIGAGAFGAVLGWSASLAIRGHSRFGLTQLSALIAAVAGGAVTAFVGNAQEMFSAYAIGLAIFFFVQRIVGHKPIADAMEQEIKKVT